MCGIANCPNDPRAAVEDWQSMNLQGCGSSSWLSRALTLLECVGHDGEVEELPAIPECFYKLEWDGCDEQLSTARYWGDSTPIHFRNLLSKTGIVSFVRDFVVKSVQQLFDNIIDVMMINSINFGFAELGESPSTHQFCGARKAEMARISSKVPVSFPWEDCHVLVASCPNWRWLANIRNLLPHHASYKTFHVCVVQCRMRM